MHDYHWESIKYVMNVVVDGVGGGDNDDTGGHADGVDDDVLKYWHDLSQVGGLVADGVDDDVLKYWHDLSQVGGLVADGVDDDVLKY